MFLAPISQKTLKNIKKSKKISKKVLTKSNSCDILYEWVDKTTFIQRQQVPVKAKATLPRRKTNSIIMYICVFLNLGEAMLGKKKDFFILSHSLREVNHNAK